MLGLNVWGPQRSVEQGSLTPASRIIHDGTALETLAVWVWLFYMFFPSRPWLGELE